MDVVSLSLMHGTFPFVTENVEMEIGMEGKTINPLPPEDARALRMAGWEDFGMRKVLNN